MTDQLVLPTAPSLGAAAGTGQLLPDGGLLLGVDLGGTKLRAALADEAGTILAEIVEPAIGGTVEAIVAQVVAVREQLAARAGRPSWAVRVAGIALPVALRPGSGLAWSTGNQVRPLIHGAVYFGELVGAVEVWVAESRQERRSGVRGRSAHRAGE